MEMSSMGTFASVSFRAIAFAVCFATVAGCDRTTVFTPDGTEVVIAPDAPKSVLFAVEEMTNLLSKAFGRDIPVVASPTPGKAGIYLGDNEWSRKAGIDVAPLKRDAFTIVSDGLNAYVAGRDDPNEDTHEAVYSPYTSVWNQLHEHATLFGVYEFLERYAGVRMYFPGELGTIIPKTTSLRVPATRFTVTPDFSVRNYSTLSGMSKSGMRRDTQMERKAEASGVDLDISKQIRRDEPSRHPERHSSRLGKVLQGRFAVDIRHVRRKRKRQVVLQHAHLLRLRKGMLEHEGGC